MKIIKKYKWLLVCISLALITVSIFITRFHQDIRTLTNFSASYERFDKAISDFSEGVLESNAMVEISVINDLERKADIAFAELKTKATIRISSLIKNDAEFMIAELEIEEFSGKELRAVSGYKMAILDQKDMDADKLAKEISDIKNKRISAYTRFRELVDLAE